MDAIENNEWAYIELRKDVRFCDFTEEQKEYIIKQSISFGNETAQKIIKDFGNPANFEDIKNIIERLGAKINLSNKQISFSRLADYDESTKQIVCYCINIQKVMEKLGQYSSILKSYELLALCAAHELFHHIENMNFKSAASIIGLERTFLKIFHYKYHPQSAREIAAHTFVQKLLNLDVSPALIVNYFQQS